jgi:hypothetical protein
LACSCARASSATRSGWTAAAGSTAVFGVWDPAAPARLTLSGATDPPGSSSWSPPVRIATGAPKPAERPVFSAANFRWSTWLIANITMNSTISSVIMSA